MESKPASKLNAIAARAARNARIRNLQMEIQIPSRGFSWRNNPETAPRPFFIASTTKLYTSALIFQLIEEGRFALETRAADILGIRVMQGLNTLSEQITIGHLLSHTSGIADYFEQKPVRGKSLGEKILANEDVAWGFEDILQSVRENMRPRFSPHSGKAFYSDTNYQLLGKVIETIAGKDFAAVLSEKILKPLNLQDTYMFAPDILERYAAALPLFHGDLQLYIPKAMASFGCDGGIVSTTTDSLRFLRAFFKDELFPRAYIDFEQNWRRIFFPLQYGVGLMRFRFPRVFTLFRRTPEFFGHSGASGTVLFYAPEKDLYICAAVNQTKYRDLPYRLLLEAGMAIE